MSDILLFSGGLDSFPAWHYLGKPKAIYFDIGHRYRDRELAAVENLAERCGIPLSISRELNLSVWEAPDAIIPLRNIYFAMLAANHADNIWCVGVKGDWTLDKNPRAFAEISSFISSHLGRKIRVDSPFWGWTKTDIVGWYVSQGLPVEDLLATSSCFEESGQHCGACPSCLRRWIALVNNGIEDKFAQNPWEWEKVTSYYFPAMRDGRYPAERAEEFWAAFERIGMTREATK